MTVLAPGTIRGLHPQFRPWAEALQDALWRFDRRFILTSGVRSKASQEALYARWLRGEHPLTVAPPGCSKHEGGYAADFARPNVPPLSDPVLFALGRYWRSIGGEWGGERDPVHFALPGRICT